MVMLTRGVDLSLGSAVSMVSVGCALSIGTATSMGLSPMLVVLVGISVGALLGAACGLFNGLTISFLGVSPFVASLGSFNIAFGIATTISSGRPVQGIPPEMSNLFYGGSLLGVPAAVVIAIVLAVGIHILLTRTVFGRSLYFLGANPRAAMVAGLPVKRITVTVYLVSALLTAIGAIMLTARTGSGEPNLGGSLSLQSIAAAVVGGTSLTGARGGVWTALLGALFVTILSNGMNLSRIDGNLQMIVLGMVIIAGVVLDKWRSGQIR
jgi:ribose transport system permease protein